MKAKIISDFYVTQNEPNPFKEKTKIKYCLPEKARVIMNLYSPHNKKVKKLVSKTQEAGEYEIHLDTEDLLEDYYYYEFNTYKIPFGFRKLYGDMKRMMILKR
jgi:hypothetical protein